ncbi:MAG: hypothetical protein HGA87_03755 [Desulfobulbaceae bacterium]|nr:hypothetical protein [Desulfobulbaceae bacterium]
MTTDNNKESQYSSQLPTHLLLFCLSVTVFGPFVARLPSVPFYGWQWLTDYFTGIGGLLFFSAFNLIPGAVLYGIGKGTKNKPLVFWVALFAGVAFILFAHGTINLRSSSTAAIGLIFIPIYCVGAIIAGWAIGLFANAVIKNERTRRYFCFVIGVSAILFGAGNAVYESRTTSVRESRFPIITVKELSLSKRTINSGASLGRVEALALGNFDKDQGEEIAALGASTIILLNPTTYEIKSRFELKKQDGNGCVGMYPYLIPDGKGGVLVASSDGVTDDQGRFLWKLNVSGFTRLVPIQTSSGIPTFFSYHNSESIDRHDIDGKVLWSVKLPTSDISTYVTPEGERLPAAEIGYNKSQELRLYDLNGKPQKSIKLPAWGSFVEEVSWPKRGHLLVGAGGCVGVLDPDGKEVLRHIIKNTSFRPYHGPEGTTVRFSTSEPPYLAVMSHGSSGYDRSVLLIFDPKGRLVWQEETKKLRSILAVPQADGKSEMLLVGGMDGITEYSFTSKDAQHAPRP